MPFRLSVAVAAVAVNYHIMTTGGGVLEAAGSGVAFTPVKGLATTGLYALSRNPLYMGLVFTAVPAFAVLLDSVWPMFLTATLLYTYLNAFVIPAEEGLLTQGKSNPSYLSTAMSIVMLFSPPSSRYTS